MFGNKYLKAFFLTLLYFLFQNLLGFLYTFTQFRSFKDVNYLQFDLYIAILTFIIVLLVITFGKIPINTPKIKNLNLLGFSLIIVGLCIFKILVDGLKYFEVTLPPRVVNKPIDKIYLFLNFIFLKPITEEFYFRAFLLYVLIKN